MIAVKIPDVAVRSEKSEQRESTVKLKKMTGSDRGHEDAQCDNSGHIIAKHVKTDQHPANIETSKSGNEDQSAEDNLEVCQSDSNDALKAKIEEVKSEIYEFSCELKKTAKSCMRLKRENNNLLQQLKQKYSKDVISKLESTNPDGNSQSLDDDEEQGDQITSESSSELNSSPDCSSDDEGDYDSPGDSPVHKSISH